MRQYNFDDVAVIVVFDDDKEITTICDELEAGHTPLCEYEKPLDFKKLINTEEAIKLLKDMPRSDGTKPRKFCVYASSVVSPEHVKILMIKAK
jgi:hypothetical protein